MTDVKAHERAWLAARLLGWALVLAALAWDAADKWRGNARNVEILMRVVQAAGIVLVAIGFERHARWARARATQEASRTPPRR